MDLMQREALSKPDGLRRELYPIHIFAIAISAVIGMGFYVRVGVLEHLGGQAAVIYAYGFLGALCLMIMTCLAIMLRIWPIAGAIVVFVERFVDPDIGKSVGVLYWLTYCFSFAGLTTAIGQLVNDLHLTKGQSVVITVASLVMPILFNLTDIQVFRNIELILVTVKLSIVVVIIIIMNVINPEVGGLVTTQTPTLQPREIVFQHSSDETWFGVLMASIFLASFSYVGIEVVAATAQEAKGGNNEQPKTDTYEETQMMEAAPESRASSPTHRDGDGIALMLVGSEIALNFTTGPSRSSSTDQGTFIHATTQTDSEQTVERDTMETDSEQSVDGDTVAFNPSQYRRKGPFQSPARYVPIVSAVLYLWGAWVVTQNVAWDDQSQPTLTGSSSGWSSSIFINSAKKSSVPHLDRALTGLLILNIASTSSTALYVASRTLFGLTFTIAKGMELNPPAEVWRQKWLRLMKGVSKKSKFDVPWAAVLMSAWPIILPFMKYIPGNTYLTVIDVVTEMGSVSCILVWGWESFAAYRFFKCCKAHPGALGAINENIVRFGDSGWYYFHLSISLFASIVCPIIVFVGGAFTVSHNANATQGVATFLVVAIFLGLTIVLKIIRWSLDPDPWWSLDRFLSNLNEGKKVKKMYGELDTLATKHVDKNHKTEPRSWTDLGGIINSDWLFNTLKQLLKKLR